HVSSPVVPPLHIVERGSGGEETPHIVRRGSRGEDTAVVNALIARLKDENAGVRGAAAHSLGRLGDPRAVPPLIAVLADSDGEVRAAAIEALADLGDARAIGPIAGLLKDPVAEVKRNALGALSHFDEGVPTAPVVALLDDPNADVRHEAIDLLDHLHARSAAGAIARMTHDPSPDVRHAAVSTLGNMGAQGPGGSPGAAGGAPVSRPQSAARRSRGAGAGSMIRALHFLVLWATAAGAGGGGPEWERPGADSARVAALLAALAHTDPVICDLIGDQLGNFWMGDDPARLGRFSDAPTRIQGAKDSLAGSVTDPRALTLLAATLGTDNPCVRRVAAKLLGRSAVSAGVLRELLADPSPRI